MARRENSVQLNKNKHCERSNKVKIHGDNIASPEGIDETVVCPKLLDIF